MISQTQSRRILAMTIALLACLFIFSAGTAETAGLIDSYKANGDAVQWYNGFYYDTGMVYSNITVSRGGTPNNPQTYITYDINGDVPQSYGWGQIPNEDFVATGNGCFTLRTHTSRILGEVNGEDGPIVVEWKQVKRDSWWKFAGLFETATSGILTKISGTSKWTVATATGSMFSYVLENQGITSADIGSYNNVTITIQKYATPPE